MSAAIFASARCEKNEEKILGTGAQKPVLEVLARNPPV
jgi:hypothetical protein